MSELRDFFFGKGKERGPGDPRKESEGGVYWSIGAVRLTNVGAKTEKRWPFIIALPSGEESWQFLESRWVALADDPRVMGIMSVVVNPFVEEGGSGYFPLPTLSVSGIAQYMQVVPPEIVAADTLLLDVGFMEWGPDDDGSVITTKIVAADRRQFASWKEVARSLADLPGMGKQLTIDIPIPSRRAGIILGLPT